jgi:hypothetical protein
LKYTGLVFWSALMVISFLGHGAFFIVVFLWERRLSSPYPINNHNQLPPSEFPTIQHYPRETTTIKMLVIQLTDLFGICAKNQDGMSPSIQLWMAESLLRCEWDQYKKLILFVFYQFLF